MSAYVVNDETISVLVDAFEQYTDRYNDYDFYPKQKGWLIDLDKERQAMGQALLDYNYKSVNYRYNEYEKPRKFKYISLDDSHKLNVVFGCIQCYNYQACEPDDYYESAIYKNLQRLKENMLRRICEREGELEWGHDSVAIDEETTNNERWTLL
ncbi:MAG: hypothetical protein IKO45_05000 [Clostridia bacterium]|nr:hypothetical protein [Clostridia bacterium]MBR4623892.1 hypothetical protein [Clostridia bacterium]